MVLPDVPRERKPERGYIRMFPRNKNRNEGTFACSPGTESRNEGRLTSEDWPTSLPATCRNKKQTDTDQTAQIGHTPMGCYSPRGCSRHLLETPFSETLMKRVPFFTAKPAARPLLRTLPQNPSQNLLRTLLRALCCHTTFWRAPKQRAICAQEDPTKYSL